MMKKVPDRSKRKNMGKSKPVTGSEIDPEATIRNFRIVQTERGSEAGVM